MDFTGGDREPLRALTRKESAMIRFLCEKDKHSPENLVASLGRKHPAEAGGGRAVPPCALFLISSDLGNAVGNKDQSWCYLWHGSTASIARKLAFKHSRGRNKEARNLSPGTVSPHL